jgi:NMD protein affecting ribosome stability and mRNA decay
MILICDMEMMSKEAMVDLCGVLSQHLPGDTKGTEENLSQDTGCSGHKFKTGIPE